MSKLLEVRKLTAGYGAAVVLNDVTFDMREGESLALLGRNGVGKSSLLETLVGNTNQSGGSIVLAGNELNSAAPARRASLGLGWVPQEREVFPSLTILENLTVVARKGYWTLARVYEHFPRLKERQRNLGSQLSGGEQQMLAIGRALMTNPKLLLLDEPMEGLAPIIVEELVRSISLMSSQHGLTSIIVEQHPALALGLSMNALVLERGCVSYFGASKTLLDSPQMLTSLLGVGREARSHARRNAGQSAVEEAAA
jgi:branched-chain amino acid transport system ATP-binding protein